MTWLFILIFIWPFLYFSHSKKDRAESNDMIQNGSIFWGYLRFSKYLRLQKLCKKRIWWSNTQSTDLRALFIYINWNEGVVEREQARKMGAAFSGHTNSMLAVTVMAVHTGNQWIEHEYMIHSTGPLIPVCAARRRSTKWLRICSGYFSQTPDWHAP